MRALSCCFKYLLRTADRKRGIGARGALGRVGEIRGLAGMATERRPCPASIISTVLGVGRGYLASVLVERNHRLRSETQATARRANGHGSQALTASTESNVPEVARGYLTSVLEERSQRLRTEMRHATARWGRLPNVQGRRQ